VSWAGSTGERFIITSSLCGNLLSVNGGKRIMGRENDSVSPWQYVDFDLEITEESTPRSYSVAARSPEGETQGRMRFPFDEWELRDKLKDVENALLRSAGKRRRIGAPEEQAVQSFGRALFEALLAGEVGAHYRMSLREARRQNKGLRLKLHVRPPELSALPWEFVYDPQHDYLCLSSMTPLVRYPDVPQPIERLTVTPPLRILGMVASPRGLPQLDVGHEKRLMEEAIKDLRSQGVVELTWLEGQSWRDLQRAMRYGPWHVFHFIGHGGFDPETEEGATALADEQGRKHLLGATALARLLDDHYSLRLVFLNSCEGARGSPRDAFSSVAANLIRCGIPAVVAMQYEITDRAAIEFSRDFYEAVADGLPVDAAVAEARTAISMANDLEWGTPVLYMRSSEGQIFDILIPKSQAEAAREHEDREGQVRLHNRYRKRIASVWADRHLDTSEVGSLDDYAKELGLSTSEASAIERDVMGDTKEAILECQERAAEEQAAKKQYRDAVERVWANNWVSDADAEGLNALGSELSLSADATIEIERDVMGDTKEAVLDLQEQASREKERQDRLDELYERGQRCVDAREWQQALECFEEIQRLEPGYRETEALLSQVRKVLAPSPRVSVPDLRGLKVSQASTTLVSKGLKLDAQKRRAGDRTDEERIIEQRPKAGTEVAIGSLVSVTAGSGPHAVTEGAQQRDTSSTLTISSTDRIELVRTLESDTSSVDSLAFSPDGRLLATGGSDNTVRLWMIEDGTLLRELTDREWTDRLGIAARATMYSIAFSPDGRLLATGGDDDTVRLWQVEDGSLLRKMLHGNRMLSAPIKSLAFSPDGRLLATGGSDNTVRLWMIEDGTLLRELTDREWTDRLGIARATIYSIAFSLDGQLLASGSDDTTVRLWQVESGAFLRTLEGHAGWVTSVSFSPSGGLLASGANDKTVRMWGVR
jgi:hypothetical protein